MAKRRETKENAGLSAAFSALYALLAYNIMRNVSDIELTETELEGVLKDQSELIVVALLK